MQSLQSYQMICYVAGLTKIIPKSLNLVTKLEMCKLYRKNGKNRFGYPTSFSRNGSSSGGSTSSSSNSRGSNSGGV